MPLRLGDLIEQASRALQLTPAAPRIRSPKRAAPLQPAILYDTEVHHRAHATRVLSERALSNRQLIAQVTSTVLPLNSQVAAHERRAQHSRPGDAGLKGGVSTVGEMVEVRGADGHPRAS
jgi:hypothetical protein